MPDLNPSRPSLNDRDIDNILRSEAAQAEFDTRYQNEPSVIDRGRWRFRIEEIEQGRLVESFAFGLNHGLRNESLDTTNQPENPYEQRFVGYGYSYGSSIVNWKYK